VERGRAGRDRRYVNGIQDADGSCCPEGALPAGAKKGKGNSNRKLKDLENLEPGKEHSIDQTDIDKRGA